jgi:two-component system cell cycle sensor histidine kinase/response regulator CckA
MARVVPESPIRTDTSPALRITLIYVFLASAWVLLSDLLLDYLIRHAVVREFLEWGVLKGLVFVGSTALLLYFLIQRSTIRLRHTAEAVRENEEQIQFQAHLLNVAVEAVTAADAAGRITFWNQFAERLYGWSAEEALGSNLFELMLAKTAVDQSEEIESLLRAGDSWSGELIAHRKNGEIFPVFMTVAPLRDEGGEVKGLVGVSADISKRKQLEEQLRQSQKMDAIGRLAGGIAHDFNNLLTAITGYSQIALLKLHSEDPLRKDIEEILKAGERATGLTRQLLAFSRRQVLQPRVLDLNSVVIGMEFMLRRLIGEDITLVTKLAPDLGKVMADPGQVEQVILNLVVNSRDAMPTGGTLTIQTADINLSEDYSHQNYRARPGLYVMLAVSDSGCGMDELVQSRAFEPFFTTKESGKGTGLGLSTVYGIVEQSGGDIRLYSQAGQGTTFKIYLPRIEEKEKKASISVHPAEVPLRGVETILLVEDEDAVRNLIRSILRQNGYTVIESRHGGEALLICERYEGPIHLLLTDVVMPQMGGGELADRLRPLRPTMKALYMSGYTDNDIIRRGAPDAESRFLQKPFTPEVLLRKIRGLLDQDK